MIPPVPRIRADRAYQVQVRKPSGGFWPLSAADDLPMDMAPRLWRPPGDWFVRDGFWLPNKVDGFISIASFCDLTCSPQGVMSINNGGF